MTSRNPEDEAAKSPPDMGSVDPTAPGPSASALLAILERISDGVVALDNDWNYTYLNSRAAKLLQRESPADLIGKHIWTEYPEGLEQPFARSYQKAAQTQKSLIFEEYYAPWDKWFENRVFPSPDGLTIFFSEITDQKKASIALRRAGTVYACTRDSVIITDTASNITSVNPAFTVNTGYTEGEILGQPVTLLWDDMPEPADWTLVQTTGSWSGDTTGRRKNGDRCPQTVSIEVLFDEHGTREGWIIIAHDLTNQQTRIAAEQQLAQAQKMEAIGNLTGGVAHDFNNLLAVIMGNLELLRDDILASRIDQQDAVRMIDAGIDSAIRGADLTRNMLSFARRARLDPKDLRLNSIVGKTRTWIGRTLPSNISFETSLLAGLWTVHADEASTQSALLNLILNARDAMPKGGRLTIETSNVRVDDDYVRSRHEEIEPGRYVMLAVSDTGDGIPPENLDHIFEPFFSTKPPGSGSGLGLSMIQGFMKQSGGTIQVYSEPGIGTTFKLYFKANYTAETDTAPPVADTDTNAAGQHILVAEDEAAVLKVIAATLEKFGYRVTAAKSGDEAKLIFQANPTFDLLLTDIVMPGDLQGTTLAKDLRALAPSLPVVFMSGYASEATVHGNGLHPEDIRLMKPVQRSDLLAAVEKALRIAGKNSA